MRNFIYIGFLSHYLLRGREGCKFLYLYIYMEKENDRNWPEVRNLSIIIERVVTRGRIMIINNDISLYTRFEISFNLNIESSQG